MKIIYVSLLLLSSTLRAQFSAQPRIGLNQNGYFIAAMDVAGRVKNIELAGTINDVQNTKAPAFFGGRIGWYFNLNEKLSIMPIIGRTYRWIAR